MLRPLKTNPPLIVDADAVLAFAISLQPLKTVAGQGSQILQELADSKRSSLSRAARSMLENAFTRLP